MPNVNLITIFLTGLLTGGLTCLAVQGGLLAATIAQKEEERLKEKTKTSGNAFPILLFLIAKITAYTVLGFLLGWFGSFFDLSLTTKIILQIAVGIFMLGTALNILNVHPIFRYFIIQPPKFLTRLVRNQSKSRDLFAPLLLGTFTIFIPCGTTQAMMALAIGSGNPLAGMAIMLAFTLGTSPVFFTLGYLATRLGDALHERFMKAAAGALILLSIFNINNAIALSGSNLTLENIWKNIYCTALVVCDKKGVAVAAGEVAGTASQEATIKIESGGYNPQILTVKRGSQIKLNVVNENGRGCIQAFVIPKLGIQKVIPPGSSETFQFTAPDKPDEFAFMCSMGMFRGTIQVI